MRDTLVLLLIKIANRNLPYHTHHLHFIPVTISQMSSKMKYQQSSHPKTHPMITKTTIPYKNKPQKPLQCWKNRRQNGLWSWKNCQISIISLNWPSKHRLMLMSAGKNVIKRVKIRWRMRKWLKTNWKNTVKLCNKCMISKKAKKRLNCKWGSI